MSKRFFFSVAVLVVLSGCGEDLESKVLGELSSHVASNPVVSSAYALKTTDAKTGAPVWKSDFTINATYDIHFSTVITGALAGRHNLSVLVYLPGGSLYQRFDVAFTTTDVATDGEQQAEKTANGYRVWVSMPVAGTMIEQYGLNGPWAAEVFVNASSAPEAKAAFALQ